MPTQMIIKEIIINYSNSIQNVCINENIYKVNPGKTLIVNQQLAPTGKDLSVLASTNAIFPIPNTSTGMVGNILVNNDAKPAVSGKPATATSPATVAVPAQPTTYSIVLSIPAGAVPDPDPKDLTSGFPWLKVIGGGAIAVAVPTVIYYGKRAYSKRVAENKYKKLVKNTAKAKEEVAKAESLKSIEKAELVPAVEEEVGEAAEEIAIRELVSGFDNDEGSKEDLADLLKDVEQNQESYNEEQISQLLRVAKIVLRQAESDQASFKSPELDEIAADLNSIQFVPGVGLITPTEIKRGFEVNRIGVDARKLVAEDHKLVDLDPAKLFIRLASSQKLENGYVMDIRGKAIDFDELLKDARKVYVSPTGRYLDDAGRYLDNYGNFVDEDYKLMNYEFRLIDISGKFINDNGQLVDKWFRAVDEKGRLLNFDNTLVDTRKAITDAYDNSTEIEAYSNQLYAYMKKIDVGVNQVFDDDYNGGNGDGDNDFRPRGGDGDNDFRPIGGGNAGRGVFDDPRFEQFMLENPQVEQREEDLLNNLSEVRRNVVNEFSMVVEEEEKEGPALQAGLNLVQQQVQEIQRIDAAVQANPEIRQQIFQADASVQTQVEQATQFVQAQPKSFDESIQTVKQKIEQLDSQTQTIITDVKKVNSGVQAASQSVEEFVQAQPELVNQFVQTEEDVIEEIKQANELLQQPFELAQNLPQLQQDLDSLNSQILEAGQRLNAVNQQLAAQMQRQPQLIQVEERKSVEKIKKAVGSSESSIKLRPSDDRGNQFKGPISSSDPSSLTNPKTGDSFDSDFKTSTDKSSGDQLPGFTTSGSGSINDPTRGNVPAGGDVGAQSGLDRIEEIIHDEDASSPVRKIPTGITQGKTKLTDVTQKGKDVIKGSKKDPFKGPLKGSNVGSSVGSKRSEAVENLAKKLD